MGKMADLVQEEKDRIELGAYTWDEFADYRYDWRINEEAEVAVLLVQISRGPMAHHKSTAPASVHDTIYLLQQGQKPKEAVDRRIGTTLLGQLSEDGRTLTYRVRSQTTGKEKEYTVDLTEL